jgi:hypothetical protein
MILPYLVLLVVVSVRLITLFISLFVVPALDFEGGSGVSQIYRPVTPNSSSSRRDARQTGAFGPCLSGQNAPFV